MCNNFKRVVYVTYTDTLCEAVRVSRDIQPTQQMVQRPRTVPCLLHFGVASHNDGLSKGKKAQGRSSASILAQSYRRTPASHSRYGEACPRSEELELY